MDRVEPDTTIHYLQGIQDWLIQYWIENEPDPDYRIALSSLLSAFWPKTGKEAKPSYFPLPSLCGYALGKLSPSTTAVNAAWSLLFVASYLLDKIEDEETHHPIFHKFSPGVIVNLTTGLILHSGHILAQLEPYDTPAEILAEIRREFQRQAILVCAGQHHDLTLKEPTFDQIWQTVDAKSGSFFALGAYLGARLASSNEAAVAAMREVGRKLGIINQINNDLSGLGSSEETGSDLASGRRTLPAQYALQVLPHEKRAKLVKYLQSAASEPAAEVEARGMIVSAGAVIYLALEAVKHRQQAVSLVQTLQISSERAEPLYNLINYSGTRLILRP